MSGAAKPKQIRFSTQRGWSVGQQPPPPSSSPAGAGAAPREPEPMPDSFNKLPPELNQKIMSGLDPQSLGRLAQVSTSTKTQVKEYRTRREERTGRTAVIKAVNDTKLLSVKQMKTFLRHRCDANVGVSRAVVRGALDTFMQKNDPKIFLELLAEALPTYYTPHVAEHFDPGYPAYSTPKRTRNYCYAPELGEPRDFTDYVSFELAQGGLGVHMFIHITRFHNIDDHTTVFFGGAILNSSDATKMLEPLLGPDSPQQEREKLALLVKMCRVVAAAKNLVYGYRRQDVVGQHPDNYRDFLAQVLYALISHPDLARENCDVLRAAFTDLAVD